MRQTSRSVPTQSGRFWINTKDKKNLRHKAFIDKKNWYCTTFVKPNNSFNKFYFHFFLLSNLMISGG